MTTDNKKQVQKFFRKLAQWQADPVAAKAQRNPAVSREMIDEFPNVFNLVKIEKAPRLLDDIKQVAVEVYPSFNSRKMLESKLKKFTRALVQNKEKLKLLDNWFLKSEEEFKIHQFEAAAKVKADNENQYLVARGDVDKLYAKFKADSESNKYAKIARVQLAIGARLIEVLNNCVSKFKTDKKRVYQTGTAKSKDLRLINKPVLGDAASTIVRMITKIRRSIDTENKDNQDITQSVHQQLNKYIRKTAASIGLTKITSSHDLRKLYINTIYYDADPNTRGSLAAWATQYLGHEPTKISGAAVNYTTIGIVAEKPTEEKKSDEYEIPQAEGSTEARFKQLDDIKLKLGKLPTYATLNEKGYTDYLVKKYKKSLKDKK